MLEFQQNFRASIKSPPTLPLNQTEAVSVLHLPILLWVWAIFYELIFNRIIIFHFTSVARSWIDYTPCSLSLTAVKSDIVNGHPYCLLGTASTLESCTVYMQAVIWHVALLGGVNYVSVN